MRDASKGILAALTERPLIFDGAMGTMIFEHGVFVNACYDELCLTRPELVQSIHKQYADVGVNVLETNTFGANRIKLGTYGLADQAEAINRAAVRLCRAAALDDAYVAGSVGPCLIPGECLADVDADAVASAFSEQVQVLCDAGVDLLVFETFHDTDELALALDAARGCHVPVLASFTVTPDRDHTPGTFPEEKVAAWLNGRDDVDLVGLNCGAGPAGMFEPLRRVLAVVDKPVVVMPNAGGPSEVGGRMLYFNTPEYFTEYAKKFIELGARGVGGCCGTTPEMMRVAIRAVQGLSGVKRHVSITVAGADESDPGVEPRPLAERSAFAARLARGERVTSVEMLPPRSGDGLPRFLERARACEAAGVDVINIPDGPRASARMSVLVTAMRLEAETGIEAVPHYCCRDRNLIGMQADLLGGAAAGIHNWLLITGDPPKLGDYPDASGVFDIDAVGLTRLANNLNHGLDAVGKPVGSSAGMVLGVGANPVAVEMNREVERYLAKIDAGADYAITQPIFEPDALFRFLDRVATSSRSIPLLVGIYPLVSFRNADFMNKYVPGVVVPDAILKRLSACTSKEDGLKCGIEMSREILAAVVPRVQGIQVSAPLGKVQAALDVLDGYVQ